VKSHRRPRPVVVDFATVALDDRVTLGVHQLHWTLVQLIHSKHPQLLEYQRDKFAPNLETGRRGSMATNLVSLVMQFLTPDMVARIASALGLDRNTAQSAISAAVPSLLAGLSNVAAQPGGPQKLLDAAKQQTGALEGFAGMLGAGSQSSFIERGSQMLSSLLGSRDQNALAGTISSFAGVGQGATGSLLGMLAPVVMGMIAKQQGTTTALDPGRIASLLAGQKDNIAAALPSGLSNLLGGAGLLDSLGGAARTATAAGNEAAWASASAARAVGDTGRRAAGAAASASNNWLYWLIPAAVIVALLVYHFAKPTEQVAQQGATTIGQSTMVSGLDINKQVADNLTSLRTTLGSITDAASAQAALPKLHEVTAQIDKVDGLSRQLSAEQRKSLAGLVNPVMPTLNQLFDKVLAIPGVSDELKPAVDALKAKLAVLAA
jgi:hypothetical protein